MTRFDVFNGDADGICGLHQWRLAFPADAELVTGVKRDIQLLERVPAKIGDEVTVFDVSIDSNREDVKRLLDEGASVRYFDHHFAGEPIHHPALDATIDTASDTCTSLLVDRALGGAFRAWAVVAAFGDNQHAAARRTAAELPLDQGDVQLLAELGDLLNYNGYGDNISDLHFPPDQLYRLVAPYSDPLEFTRSSTAFAALQEGFAKDMALAEKAYPCVESDSVAAWILPDAAWARRAVGLMSNRLAAATPDRAHAVLVPNSFGAITVSVRAPKNRPTGADEFCRRFPTGGGRKSAAGVNRLPSSDSEVFIREFADFFKQGTT